MGYSGTVKRHDSARAVNTPSFYGSHKSMVVDPSDFDFDLGENEVICYDDYHYYVTTKNFLDNGLADVNRYGNPSNNLVKKVKEEQKEEWNVLFVRR